MARLSFREKSYILLCKVLGGEWSDALVHGLVDGFVPTVFITQTFSRAYAVLDQEDKLIGAFVLEGEQVTISAKAYRIEPWEKFCSRYSDDLYRAIEDGPYQHEPLY